jgi:hypothetical protein
MIKLLRAILFFLVLSTSLSLWADEQTGSAPQTNELQKSVKEALLAESDFLLAQVYHDKGQWRLALFALERVLIVQPDNMPARLMSAKIYIEQKQMTWAQKELAHIAPKYLNTKQAKQYRNFKSQINAYKDRYGPLKLTSNIAVTIGHDSNVTYGPDFDSIILPSQTSATDLSDARSDGDQYLLTSVYTTGKYALNRSTTLNNTIGYTQKNHQQRTDVNEGYLNLYSGVSKNFNNNVVTVTGLHNSYWVDDELDSQYWGGQLNGTSKIAKGQWLLAYIRYIEYSYEDDSTYDSQKTLASLSHLIWFDKKAHPTSFKYGLYSGELKAQDSSYEYIGYSLWGGITAISYQLKPNIKLYAGLTFEIRDHESEDPYYATQRNDELISLYLSSIFTLKDGWSITPNISYSKNNSNMAMYGYERYTAGLTIMREFKNEIL